MAMMDRFWRTFRLGLLVIAFITVTFYLIATTQWGKLFGHPPTYAVEIKDAEPVVAAVYQFKADRGLWPEYFEDLAPQYLPPSTIKKDQDAGWFYEWHPDGPVFSKPVTDLFKTHVGFCFENDQPAWRVFGDEDNRILRPGIPPTIHAATTLPANQVVTNELAELDRRIDRSPRMMRYQNDLITLAPSPVAMDYRRQKISLLLSLGREPDARTELAKAQTADPENFWPHLAAVALDTKNTTPPTATESAATEAAVPPASLVDFEKWVQANPSFTHWYYLSVAQRLAGREPQALAAVEEAAKLPPELAPDDNEVMAFYFWDMTRLALKAEQWDLVLSLTDSWSKAEENRPRFKQDSYLALSAAAHLAKGNTAAAQTDLAELEKRKTTTWARHRDLLEAAVKNANRTFRYDPGDTPPMYQVFILPQ